MRPLEILLTCILAIYLLYPFITSKVRSTTNYLPFLALFVMVLHLILEKYRWQMIPLYVFVVLSCLMGFLRLLHPQQERFKRFSLAGAGLIVSLLILIAATTLPILLPVPKVPIPSGPYQIGTTTLVLVDENRAEIYSDDPSEPRKFIAQVWYPAVPTPDSERAPWMADAQIVAPSIADYLELEHFFLDHLTLVTTNSYLNAPADRSNSPYPLLLFSHGWNGFRAQNTNQIQELVSYGYVVASIEYTYAATISVFPDGQIAPNNPDILPHGVSDAEYATAAHLLLEQWTGDMDYTLVTLSSLNKDDPAGIFTGLLDLENIGAFGHSTGGGATIQFCSTDTRCKAGLTMDAWLTPVSEQVLNSGTDRPLLFLFSETFPTEKNWRLFDRLSAHLSGPVTVATIAGTAHYDFSDLPSLSPLAPQMGLKGPLKGQRVIQITNDYSLAFFNEALKGIPTTLLDGASSVYPELEFREMP